MTGIGTMSELVGCSLNVHNWYASVMIENVEDVNEAHHLILILVASVTGSSLES